MKKYFFMFIFLFIPTCQIFCFSASLEIVSDNKINQQLAILITLGNNELLYKDSINISVDSPYITLSPWRYDKNPVDTYDETTKETKTVFDDSVKIALEITKKKDTIHDSFLYLTYQTNQQPIPQQQLFALNFSNNESENTSAKSGDFITPPAKPFNQPEKPRLSHSFALDFQSYSATLSVLVKQTKSLPIRLILVFLLGIFLSLTPCIYPMIPITVGILQAHKSKSVFYNFLHSCAYTLGISMTFALFGILASFTGPIYGKLLMNPVWIGALVLLLGYLGFSMFGFYDVQLPKFLHFKNRSNQTGSLISSFLFGTASGTIASPCVSPGLILLLSIVASLGNIFLGFLLLFVFGIGLSTPLLLIGTFSSSLPSLPRAGLWMVEIKKLFGIVLFGVCFYYASNILPYHILLYLISVFLMIIGVYYFWFSQQCHSKNIKIYSNIVGFFLLAGAMVVLGFNLEKQFLASVSPKQTVCWMTDYPQALQQARCQNKLLFLDFWAEYCSICKSINKNILQDPAVENVLKKMVIVSINGTDRSNQPYQALKKQFHIVGFPTFLVVDSKNETILKEWHSELYHIPKKEFVEMLLNYAK